MVSEKTGHEGASGKRTALIVVLAVVILALASCLVFVLANQQEGTGDVSAPAG